MSKFRDSMPAASPISDTDRDAELRDFQAKARAELVLRLRYRVLRSALQAIETLEAVPDDWRAKLAAFNGMAAWLGDLPEEEGDGEAEEEEGEDDQ
jgi:hypothetical protein